MQTNNNTRTQTAPRLLEPESATPTTPLPNTPFWPSSSSSRLTSSSAWQPYGASWMTPTWNPSLPFYATSQAAPSVPPVATPPSSVPSSHACHWLLEQPFVTFIDHHSLRFKVHDPTGSWRDGDHHGHFFRTARQDERRDCVAGDGEVIGFVGSVSRPTNIPLEYLAASPASTGDEAMILRGTHAGSFGKIDRTSFVPGILNCKIGDQWVQVAEANTVRIEPRKQPRRLGRR